MDELIKTLPKLLRAVGDSPDVAEAAVIAAWKYTTGEGLRRHAVAKQLDGKTLVVEVRDAIWQNQLRLMKNQLVFRVNSILGQPMLSNIDMRVNPSALRIERKPPHADIVDNEVPIELWSAASCIEDKQLRQKFLRAALGLLKRKETRV
jgi:hypothetical protein